MGTTIDNKVSDFKNELPLIFFCSLNLLIRIFRFVNVICLEDEAFHALINKVISRIKEETKAVEEKWISDEEAMYKLRITSKTTLQKMRDEGNIRYTQPRPKLILYDTDSINDYLNKHAKNTF